MSHVPLGKYELIAELGRGGMADVFLAVLRGPAGLGFSKLLVIKRLRSHLASDPEFVAMLVDEARIAARLNHPNVVQTVEIGEADGEYFLAMEYLDGQPLRQIQQRAAKGADLPRAMYYAILRDVLAGLHHAHELADFDGTPLNVVHRDISPHNVFVTYDGQVKVVDFGIAKAVGRAAETRHGMVKGKAPYMAPEQARGDIVDRRADIFAVGIMLWEAATSKRYWGGAKENQILSKLAHQRLPDASPRAVDPTVPEEIDALCRRALAVSPKDRFGTAAEFEVELHRYLEKSGDRVSAREVGALLSKTFEDKRAELRRVIEGQLVELGDTRAAPLSSDGSERIHKPARAAMPKVDAAENPRASEPPREATVATVHRETAPDPPTPSVITGTRGSLALSAKARIGIYAAIAVAALLALSIGFVGGKRASPPRAPDSPAALTAPPRLAEITISLRASPATARFHIDDGPSLDNPTISKRPKDGREHQVTVEADGYVPLVRQIPFVDDASFQFSLLRAAAEPSPVRKTR